MGKCSQSARRRFARVGSGASVCLRYRLPRAADRLPRAPKRSREARTRRRYLEHARTHPVGVTCARFGIARSTFSRWRRRYDPQDLRTLEDRPRRPRRARRPAWTAAPAEAVRAARDAHPRRGKDKPAVVLGGQGVRRSVSMVGRILADLKRRGLVRGPPVARVRPRARHRRPYAARKPKDYPVARPGDLVRVDTMRLAPLPGVERRQSTAVDAVSRWGVLGVRACATAGAARDYLAELRARPPFPIRALQVDGGSEFEAEFEAACREQGLALFALPPRSPKLNGRVERANRTAREEFWGCYDGALELEPLRAAPRAWEDGYHRARPHQALGDQTPAAFLAALGEPRL